jgi:omega-6 fatty acid desaturase (delta-12 desaturase)
MRYNNNEVALIKNITNKYGAKDELAWFHLITTTFAYGGSLILMNWSLWFMPLLIMCNMRLFMIFHDCCHLSYFESGNAGWNMQIAQWLEPFVLFEAKGWQSGHNNHHSVNGNIKLFDDTKTVITLNTYDNLSIPYKIIYRTLRTPPIFFMFIPLIVFYFNQILCKPRIFIKYACVCFGLRFIFGGNFLYHFLLTGYISAIIGTMLFHLQHQVNAGFWEDYDQNDRSAYHIAQLHSSSMLVVPPVFKWATFGIEYHHIHHLNTRVPSYNMQKCHEENYHLFDKITVVGYKQAFLSLFHTLYDEKNKKYISFPIAQDYGLQG